MVIGKLKKETGKVSVLWLYQFKSENHISEVRMTLNISLSKNDFGVQSK